MQDPLALDPETMRRWGYRVVDMLVARALDESAPPLRRATPAEMRARLGGPPPEEPEPFEQVLVTLERDVLPFASRGDHPGFLAFVPFAGTWPGALGDFVASAANVYAGSWMESAGPSQVELEVLRWFAGWVGYSEEAAGVLVSGGSAANLTALACAREARVGPMSGDVVAYVSDQGHSSLARAARLLGFRSDQLRVLPSAPDFRLAPAVLTAAIEADVAAGRVPLFVSASGGATNSGSVDPLRDLAAVCSEHGVWFHVDAAYGGFAALTERGRAALDGLELADSITLDPHKWLYQPYECGCLLVREHAALRRAFEIVPDYLRDAVPDDGEVNFADLGLQPTRTSRALKVWLSLRTLGVRAFRQAIDASLDVAEAAVRRIEDSRELELAAPPSLGVVCFRRRFGEDEERRNAALVAAVEESGAGLVSSTRLHGRYAIRICVLSHTTTGADVDRVLDVIERAEVPAAPAPARDGLPAVELDRLAAAGEVREIAAGEAVVRRLDGGRDFFAVLDGAAEVRLDGSVLRRLGPGEFFGELAALDWGAGYGSARSATVVALEPLRVLAVPPERFNALLHELPTLAAAVREAVAERLPLR